jgi:short-subunit dehydrogenase
MMKPEPFRDQVVIVTGSSAGIGKSLAIQLAGQGAKVAIAARRAERLEQIAGDCRASGGEVLVIPTDVSDESQCKNLIERTVEKYGQLDMLINNAGMAASALLDEFPDLNLFRQTMEINFYGTVYCTYYALPHLKQGEGRIVAVSSLGGKSAIPYNTPYCSSKYAVHGFFDSLRMELVQHGVSCTVICPWWVATEFHEAQLAKDGKARGSIGRAYYTKKTMTSDQCAKIVLDAAYKRRREVLMGPGVLTTWLKMIAPGFVDWFAVEIFLKSAARRAKSGKIEV